MSMAEESSRCPEVGVRSEWGCWESCGMRSIVIVKMVFVGVPGAIIPAVIMPVVKQQGCTRIGIVAESSDAIVHPQEVD